MSEDLRSEVGVWWFVTSFYQQKLSIYFTCSNQISFGGLHPQIKPKSPQIVLQVEEGKKEKEKRIEKRRKKKGRRKFLCVCKQYNIPAHAWQRLQWRGHCQDCLEHNWGNIGRYFLWKWKISLEIFLMKYWETPHFPLMLIFQYSRMKFSLAVFYILYGPIFMAFPKLSPNIFSCDQYRKWIGNYTVNPALQPKV